MTGEPTQRIIRSCDGTALSYLTVGEGPGVIVVGGVLHSALDYLPLAVQLAHKHEVHILDRRGRGGSGEQGRDYCMRKECEDLLALQTATGAKIVFGHSYGGLVALETAAATTAFEIVSAYEPPLVALTSDDTRWFETYATLLARGDSRGAFACFVRAVGHVPTIVKSLPLWHMRAILRLAIRKQEWAKMEPLLWSNLVEHRELASRTVDLHAYGGVKARVLLLGGSKSPRHVTAPLFELEKALSDAHFQIIPGLDHTAPQSKHPRAVADAVLNYLESRGDGFTMTDP